MPSIGKFIAKLDLFGNKPLNDKFASRQHIWFYAFYEGNPGINFLNSQQTFIGFDEKFINRGKTDTFRVDMLAKRKCATSLQCLRCQFRFSTKAMNYPELPGIYAFFQFEKLVEAAYAMNNHRLLYSLGKDDLFLENEELLLQWYWAVFV